MANGMEKSGTMAALVGLDDETVITSANLMKVMVLLYPLILIRQVKLLYQVILCSRVGNNHRKMLEQEWQLN